MRRNCAGCKTWFDGEHWQWYCWKCWRERQEREQRSPEFDADYGAGFRKGYQRGYELVGMDRDPATHAASSRWSNSNNCCVARVASSARSGG